ncbi:DDE_Tnp_1_7 domain-containing protein [Trichonephila clavipes]|uniref:DDE_Tnp_1_7 domain-containing protein n=1 Tax=Trichonephila clavipes TaxID=2585209 RepID=A0A8X6R9W9_TRICX|nr:DDE_Tnp_1_7 domain-containing protein [Trichonephila clavipes]
MCAQWFSIFVQIRGTSCCKPISLRIRRLRLMEPLENKARNITSDNFFTTLILPHMLKTKNASLNGTMKRKRKEVPKFVKKVKLPLCDTLLAEHDDITLTVYQGKTIENVLLLSSLHPTVDIGNNYSKKLPETISFYNSTKFGVDIADQMARKYSVKAGSRRWPVNVFYNILDIAGNSWILYKEFTEKKLTRREYLQQLIVVLYSAYIHKRKYKSATQTKADTTEESAQMRKRIHYDSLRRRTIRRLEDSQFLEEVARWLQGAPKVVSHLCNQFQTSDTVTRNIGQGCERSTTSAQDHGKALSARQHRQKMDPQLARDLAAVSRRRIFRKSIYRQLGEADL